MLAVAVRTWAPLENLVNMIYEFPTFYGGVGEVRGAYGRGLTRVLDPASTPMFDDGSSKPPHVYLGMDLYREASVLWLQRVNLSRSSRSSFSGLSSARIPVTTWSSISNVTVPIGEPSSSPMMVISPLARTILTSVPFGVCG